MAVQKVNTEGIGITVSTLTSTNSNINIAFENMKKTCSNIEGTWNSRAGDKAVNQMYQIFKGNEARSSVMQNYIALLQQIVTPGYIQGENENSKLADMFL